MQNYNGQPQQVQQPQQQVPQQVPQQMQYQQYPGYGYPQKPKSEGGIFALLALILSGTACFLELVGSIVYGAASGSGAYVAAGILLILGLVLGAVGATFGGLALLKNKGNKLFAQLGFCLGLVGFGVGLATLGQAIQGFRIGSYYF